MKVVATGFAAFVSSRNKAKELSNELQIKMLEATNNVTLKREQVIFKDGSNESITRRGLAWLIMGVFSFTMVWATLFPGVEIVKQFIPPTPEVHTLLFGLIRWGGNSDPMTISITLGDLLYSGFHIYALCAGFYFTPSVNK